MALVPRAPRWAPLAHVWVRKGKFWRGRRTLVGGQGDTMLQVTRPPLVSYCEHRSWVRVGGGGSSWRETEWPVSSLGQMRNTHRWGEECTQVRVQVGWGDLPRITKLAVANDSFSSIFVSSHSWGVTPSSGSDMSPSEYSDNLVSWNFVEKKGLPGKAQGPCCCSGTWEFAFGLSPYFATNRKCTLQK